MVFWTAVDALFGSDLRRAICTEEWGTSTRIIRFLRQDVLWSRFVSDYKDIVAVVNESNREFAEAGVISKFREQYPSLIGVLSSAD